MNFFSRRSAAVDPNTANATGTREKRSFRQSIMGDRSNERNAGPRANTWNTRPTFGQWLKATWLDILTMAVMGAIGLGIYEAHPAPTRSFPVLFQDGQIVYPQFAYPLRNRIVPIWLSVLLGTLIPIFIFLCMQIRIRSFWDLNNAILGLFYAIITGAVFQVFIKWLIGGLRPHFLSVCKPAIQPGAANTGNGYMNIMYDRSICTGDTDTIDDSLESFPSGHAVAAYAGFVYLYLYLNAKLKVWSNYHPAYWKLIATYTPILGATLISGSLTIDQYHNWYDVLAGGIIGTIMAFSAYRMVYASVWDFRFNHIPLTRHAPFTYGAGPSAWDGFHDATFTRKAGWGVEQGNGAWGGAPGDASSGPRGTPFNGAPGTGPGHVTNGYTNGATNGLTYGQGHRPTYNIGRRPVPGTKNGTDAV
ncbi:acid phosphatase/Vanadium-dependent haloperoxidase [Rhizodiscina lignyota]|uniref:Acid phosphatase/Vanadium-dependent haloperoxidase n=1 Tax=Rhizodiscina lignyota TaxID=1504668 RepID=A0A9P4IT13_9PEZI|nr:acid phosphatase/Vanadium-dependent haloperoxidase [Rhizodiscina lignyota]